MILSLITSPLTPFFGTFPCRKTQKPPPAFGMVSQAMLGRVGLWAEKREVVVRGPPAGDSEPGAVPLMRREAKAGMKG